MKKIIKGKLYDTDTAHFIIKTDNELYLTDARYVKEFLYKKKNGEFFVHGQGGGFSPYGQSNGEGMCSGENITPITLEAAKEFIEKSGDVDCYIALFGEVEE